MELGLGFFQLEANYEARVFVEKKDVCSQTHNPFTQKKIF
jgi:hypothetical protein